MLLLVACEPLAVADAVNAGISLAFLGLFPNSANWKKELHESFKQLILQGYKKYQTVWTVRISNRKS